MMMELWDQIEPALMNLLVVTVLALLAMAAVLVPKILLAVQTSAVSYFERKTGIVVEQKWQDDLHKAAATGATNAIDRIRQGVLKAEDMGGLLDVVLSHMKQSVPDAISGLKPTTQVLINVATAKLTKEIEGYLARQVAEQLAKN